MIRTLVVVCAAALLVAAVSAVQDLSGKWTMKVSGGPHGDAAMSLALKQEGEKVTAAFDPGHDGEIPMSGTFAKGALTLTSPANNDGSVITMKATMKADGSLSGFMSSMMGDMTWTATRDKGK
jgi:hypothetical protein